jgi:hypothetical protein
LQQASGAEEQMIAEAVSDVLNVPPNDPDCFDLGREDDRCVLVYLDQFNTATVSIALPRDGLTLAETLAAEIEADGLGSRLEAEQQDGGFAWTVRSVSEVTQEVRLLMALQPSPPP